MDLSEQAALIARLREDVERSRRAFEVAKKEHDRAVARMKELGATHPDGAVRHATSVYTHALLSYRNALYRFNRVILDGKLPDDEKSAS